MKGQKMTENKATRGTKLGKLNMAIISVKKKHPAKLKIKNTEEGRCNIDTRQGKSVSAKRFS